MESASKLQIDLTDPNDIKAKLPVAQELYASKLEALEQMRRDVEHWARLVTSLAQMVGEEVEIPEPLEDRRPRESWGAARIVPGGRWNKKESPAQDRAIGGLKRAGRPMGPADLYRFMEGEDMKVPATVNALGAALWNALKSGRVKKTDDGLYALPDWEDERPKLEAPQEGSGTVVAPMEVDSNRGSTVRVMVANDESVDLPKEDQ